MKTIELKSCSRCFSNHVKVEVFSDPDYPTPNVWFVSEVFCAYCLNLGPRARCSDASAAIESASRLWNDLVG